MPRLIRKPPKNGQFYLNFPPKDVMRDWIDNNVQSHITGVIVSGFKTWYGVIQESPNGALSNMVIKIMWDSMKRACNIKIQVGKDPSYRKWEYEVMLVEVCNITTSAKDGFTKFQLLIRGDVVTLGPLKSTLTTFVMS
jgi:hypothetical protein